MENWLQAYDQIDAVIADSGIQQQGAARPWQERAPDEVKVWKGDGLQAWIRRVDSESIPSVIVQPSAHLRALAVDACAAILPELPCQRSGTIRWRLLMSTTSIRTSHRIPLVPTSGGTGGDLPEEWLPES